MEKKGWREGRMEGGGEGGGRKGGRELRDMFDREIVFLETMCRTTAMVDGRPIIAEVRQLIIPHLLIVENR